MTLGKQMWNGDISQCAVPGVGDSSGDQDSFLHSGTSEHTIGFTPSHGGQLCTLSTESQVLEQQGLFYTTMVIKLGCSQLLPKNFEKNYA